MSRHLEDPLSSQCDYDPLEYRCPDMEFECKTCFEKLPRPQPLYEHCIKEHGRYPTRVERTPIVSYEEVRVARGERNYNAKLTADDIRAIRAAVARGDMLKKDIASCYGISPGNLTRIITGETWSHVV